jgi:lipid-A-disaccharide synthase
MPSLCFSAGDPSGDAHAARLIDALRRRLGDLRCSGLGGPAMAQAGVLLLDDLTKASAIGPFDAARHLGRLLRAKRLFDEHLKSRRPDLVILVDFGDYNLPVIAPLAKRHGVPVLYYISPQLWAWGRWRMRSVKRFVDRMVVFFPFEETLYRQAGVAVTWVGHPLVDAAQPSGSREEAFTRLGLNPWRRTVGLLPGSRDDEVRRHLPLMLATAHALAWHMPGVQFLLVKAPSVSAEAVAALCARVRQVEVRVAEGGAYDALQVMEAAMVASGTATLEAALCGVPMVVVYRGSWPTYIAAKAVVRVPHIALVNVVAGKRLVPELIQHHATPGALAAEVMSLLRDEERCRTVKEGLREVREKLGPPGAVERAASVVMEMLGLVLQQR